MPADWEHACLPPISLWKYRPAYQDNTVITMAYVSLLLGARGKTIPSSSKRRGFEFRLAVGFEFFFSSGR